MGNKRKKKTKGGHAWIFVAAAVVMAGIIWWTLGRTSSSTPASTAHLPKPSIQTLAPELFTGKIRAAYQAAKDAPEVLAQMPCFCGCKDAGHLNNLFCFKDSHGVHCPMCQDIALEARDMHQDGLSIDAIRERIRARYARYAP